MSHSHLTEIQNPHSAQKRGLEDSAPALGNKLTGMVVYLAEALLRMVQKMPLAELQNLVIEACA